MAKLKLSKESLTQRREQLKLYRRLLPSLDLKRRQLTVEAAKARREYEAARAAVEEFDARIGSELPMLAGYEGKLSGLVRMTGYEVGEQNLTGVKLPVLRRVECRLADYPRLATPAWVDILVSRLKDAAEQRVRAGVAGERAKILDLALRRITQRVNLFDKILIPSAESDIRRIRIFLGDLERAAVVTAKIAKQKHAAIGL